MTGPTIQIHLLDGTPDGLRRASRSHWTGVALACSRSRYLEARTEREEYTDPGVYVLNGASDDPNFEGRIYIGEGEEPRKRIDSHLGRDFWARAVVFSSPQSGLNKASIRYLEARLIGRAHEVGRSQVENSAAPGLPALSEADTADAEAFLADMLTIYPLLGVRSFERVEDTTSETRLLLTGPGTDAEGALSDDGFIVFEGGRARAETVASLSAGYSAQREALLEAGALEPLSGGEQLRLTTNHTFSSPSAAAAVMLGRPAAGPAEWKDSAGVSLKALTEQKLAASDVPIDNHEDGSP